MPIFPFFSLSAMKKNPENRILFLFQFLNILINLCLIYCSLLCSELMARVEMEESLSDGLTAKFEKQEHCDVAFEVEGRRILAHRVVLGVRSVVLDELTRGWNTRMQPILIDMMDRRSFVTLLR